MEQFPKKDSSKEQGRRICSWCKKDLGPVKFESKMNSHTICEECKVRYFPELNEESE